MNVRLRATELDDARYGFAIGMLEIGPTGGHQVVPAGDAVQQVPGEIRTAAMMRHLEGCKRLSAAEGIERRDQLARMCVRAEKRAFASELCDEGNARAIWLRGILLERLVRQCIDVDHAEAFKSLTLAPLIHR